MKRLFIIAAVACVTLASCVKNEPVATPEFGEQISFETPVLAPNVKAVNEVGTAFENAVDFDVWACLTANQLTGVAALNWTNNYIVKGKIIKKTVDESSVWGGQTAYYWPSTGYLNFIAVSPSGVSNVTIDGSGVNIDDYVVNGGVDLLYSERTIGQNSNNVSIQFKHALASIDFKAAAGAQSTWIKSIKIVNVANTGDFAQGLEDTAESTTDSESDLWTSESGLVEYAAFTSSEDTGYTALDQVLTDLTADVNETSLILLPQAFGAESTAKIVVEYHQGLAPTEETPAKEFEYVLKNAEWESGIRYTYSMTFGVNEIFFEPTTTAWGTDPVTMQ